MDIIRSRQNSLIKHLIALGSDTRERDQTGEFLCAGMKLLQEAISSGAEITCTLASEPLDAPELHLAAPVLLRSVSPLQNSPGPVFSVRKKTFIPPDPFSRVLILENVQDPGNVGTVLRTADAFGIDLVVLCGACADAFGPKSVRASMGAIFRQAVLRAETDALPDILDGLPLYGAALRPGSLDVKDIPKHEVAVAVGNEGKGLSDGLLALCRETVLIPMEGRAESLNAGVAAAVIMWEMVR